MEPKADSLILKMLRELSPKKNRSGEVSKRRCAVVCDKNDPDPLPRSIFRP